MSGSVEEAYTEMFRGIRTQLAALLDEVVGSWEGA